MLIHARPDGMVTVNREHLANPADPFRRSVYLLTRRAYNLSLLTVFDQPLVATNCLDRGASALPLQSLFMINDAFLAEQAEPLRPEGRTVYRCATLRPKGQRVGHSGSPWPASPTRRRSPRAPSCCTARRSAGFPPA